MQADMYNLYPAIGEVNGRRSNYSMAIIEGEKREFGRCDVEIKNKKIGINFNDLTYDGLEFIKYRI